MDTPEKTSFGVILSFFLPEFDLDKEKLFEAFQKSGIDEVYWPKERKTRKAFKKALKDSIDGEDGFLIRPCGTSKDAISAGLVLEQKDTIQKDLKYDVKNIITLNSNLETIVGKNDFRTSAIVESFKGHRQQIGNIEILFKLKELLFNSMAIEILCRKSHFIPAKFKENVDKILVLFGELANLGAPVAIEMIAVDSGTQTRNTIVNHFRTQTLVMLQKEIDFCVAQRQRFETGELKFLKESAFRNLLTKVKIIEERIKTYIQLLEMTTEEDKEIWEKMDELDEEINTNIDLSMKRKKVSKKDAMKFIS